MFAERLRRVSASPTMKVAAEAAKLRRQGVDVVDFSAGEPDFPTPEHARPRPRRPSTPTSPATPPPAGIPELKQAICARYKADYGVSYRRTKCS